MKTNYYLKLFEEFKNEFAEKGTLADINFDFTYIILIENKELNENLRVVLPLIHNFKIKSELTKFTKKLIKEAPDTWTIKYVIAYEKLVDDVFKGFFFSVKDYQTNIKESKLYYIDNGRIVYEIETTENELVLI